MISKRVLTPYFGPSKVIQASSPFDYPRNFVPARGPKGRRNVISHLEIKATIDFSANATGVAGEDLCNWCKLLEIDDAAGKRINLTGQQLRAFGHFWLGNGMLKDPQDTGASAGNFDHTHVVPFACPRLAEPEATALEADVWRREGTTFRITVGAEADFQVSGTDPVYDSNPVTVQVVAYCYEELSYTEHVRFVADAVSTDDDLEFNVTGLGGRPVLFLGLTKQGEAGGTAQTVTTVQISDLHIRRVNDEYVKSAYRRSLGDVPANEQSPWLFAEAGETLDARTGKGFPLVFAPMGAKVKDLPAWSGDLEIKLEESSGVTSKKIMRVYLDRPSEDDRAYTRRINGIASASPRGLMGGGVPRALAPFVQWQGARAERPNPANR